MIELRLNDENFETEIKKAEKPVIVDFWAFWCSPCLILTPVLEKIVKEYEDKLILAKVNIDEASFTAKKFQVDRIPMVILFKDGQPISGFIGARPEPFVREWLKKTLPEIWTEKEKLEKEESKPLENKKEESDYEEKRIAELTKWAENYARKNGFKLNPNKEVVKNLIKGLLMNEKKYGQKYCPCRRISGDLEEDRPKICPCKWHKEEIERDGHCYCGLFYKK